MKLSLAVMLLALMTLAGCVEPAPFTSPPQIPLSPLSPPQPTISVAKFGPSFRLDPFIVGATEVSGQGPIGFPLVIIDVTYGARELGRGRADSQGNFRISVSEPLEAGHLIGLTVDLTPEQANDLNLNNQLFEIRGPGYRYVPNLATVFDSYEIK